MEDQFILNVPIFFCTFNRLDCTKKVFEQIQKIKPKKLYLASDGPREDVQGEEEKVRSVREYLLQNINWECEVHNNFSEKNMGCGRRMSSGITWAFENEDRLIILEDDCLVDQSFFRFCQDMLELYYNDERIGSISGHRVLPELEMQDSYLFSAFFDCWGWATWKRVWEKYDFDIMSWPEKSVLKYMKKIMNRQAIKSFKNCFNGVHTHTLDSWAYQFGYLMFRNRTLVVIPEKSMVKNIGFGDNATHTKNQPVGIVIDRSYEMEFPLKHPSKVIRDKTFDKIYVKSQWKFNLIPEIKILLGMDPNKSIWEKS